MKAKRKRHEPQFKARVALEAIKGIKTVQQIAKEFDVHPVQASDWKKKLNEHASSVFDTGKEREQEDFGEERTVGMETIYCKPRTSIPDKSHRIYPYLLRDLAISRPDQVWCADITYVPMPRGHAYLCAVMDWHTRCVLGWAVSNTMEVTLCLLALDRARARAGCVPEIFNTDQGSQFTSQEWSSKLAGWGVKISMDGRGRWMDNVFIERLWRSIKYEEIYGLGRNRRTSLTRLAGVAGLGARAFPEAQVSFASTNTKSP